MTNKELNSLLGKIENQMIKNLNWHKDEKMTTEGFLREEGSSEHLKYINAYEDGSISAYQECITILRKFYKFYE